MTLSLRRVALSQPCCRCRRHQRDAVVSQRFFDSALPLERYEIIVIPPDPLQGLHSAIAPER
jgi:hypothetical protein